MDTIYALSSGQPPAGIAVIRISGPQAGAALRALAGTLPDPRRATTRHLRNEQGEALDHAMILWLPGPGTVTGEDLVELHVHGGRAVVAAVKDQLAGKAGLREAEPGEFTRRAFANGRIDLAEAEGLADLLSAETELQRRSAMAMAGGAFSREVETWRASLMALSASVEAVLDFSDEDDVTALNEGFRTEVARFSGLLREWLDRPRAEALKQGYRVVLAGPPNSGKSTLFNALLGDQAAIISEIAGTTRDVLERSVARAGVPFTFVDTAGLREDSDDAIERVGIVRAREQVDRADCIVWLGAQGEGPEGAIEVDAKSDLGVARKVAPAIALSAATGEGVESLWGALLGRARVAMPKPGSVALNARQYGLVAQAEAALSGIEMLDDPLLVGEHLRQARVAFDQLIGRSSTEDMLDALFGRFCIGK